MTALEQQSRPGGGPGAARSAVAAHPESIGESPRPHLTAAERATALPAYCLLVRTPSDRTTRRLFLSLHAAMRAAERAQKRGSAAHLELCQILPVTPDVTAGGEPR